MRGSLHASGLSTMAPPLTDRIALVTGASRGIGYATAVALAKRGAHVVATARTPGGLEELDDAIRAEGGTATLVPFELRDTEAIPRLAAALTERYGKLDILIGNAALGATSSPLDHFEPKEWDNVLAINVTANWHLIRSMDAPRPAAPPFARSRSRSRSRSSAAEGTIAASRPATHMMARKTPRRAGIMTFSRGERGGERGS